MKQQTKGKAEMGLGVALVIAGVLGFVFGRTAKGFWVRIVVFALSLVAIVSGVYLFVTGLDEKAIGTAGTYQIGGQPFQTVRAIDKDQLAKGILAAKAIQPDLRRMHLVCPDKSQEVTIYVVGERVYGIPDKDVACKDGTVLLKYGTIEANEQKALPMPKVEE